MRPVSENRSIDTAPDSRQFRRVGFPLLHRPICHDQQRGGAGNAEQESADDIDHRFAPFSRQSGYRSRPRKNGASGSLVPMPVIVAVRGAESDHALDLLRSSSSAWISR
jgi:hypothetical protein